MADNKQESKEDCIFCKIIKGEIKSDIISDEENFIVMKDKYPKTEGHCLIIPKKHYETILDMPSTLGAEVISLAKKNGLRLIKEGKAEGFNFIQNNFSSAGQVVMHAHFHVILRKKGDNVRL